MQNGRIITIAVAALAALTGFPGKVWAPPPTPRAQAGLAARTLAAQPVRHRQVAAPERECLALNVYWESRGQPDRGQQAVAHVTLNRVGSASFPATICGVVHQGGRDGPCQFGWYCDGRPDQPTSPAGWAEALAAADRALAGAPDPTHGALYFHGLQERPQWAKARYGRKIIIGNHVFFNVKGVEQVAETAER